MNRYIILSMMLFVSIVFMVGGAFAETDIQTLSVSVVQGTLQTQHVYNDDEIVGNYVFSASTSMTANGWSGFGHYTLGKACIEPTACAADGNCGCAPTSCYASCFCRPYTPVGFSHYDSGTLTGACGVGTYAGVSVFAGNGVINPVGTTSGYIIFTTDPIYTVSGSIMCIESVSIYWHNPLDQWVYMHTLHDNSSYSFTIASGVEYRLVFSDGGYYDFTCDGDEVFDYNACIWVYGYTCGIDTIKLYKDDGGWVLDATEPQSTSYDEYEMQIANGEDYKISFLDGGTVCYNQTFSCSGDHVHVDYDRCNWVYPPSPWALPYIIYLYTGYDYNIVVLKDTHGNFIENSQIAVYDKTDNTHIHKWTDSADGYILLGAMFDTDHDVQISVRTFDGIFTLDTTYPANGSAAAGDEDITTTNWTIPIMYNLDLEPVDQSDKPLFDVFCTLSEYTPFDPLSFWGMDLSDNGYVPVTNCSGFAMCDIVAEKDGYTDYNVTALNWTTRSALTKDYRHNIVMEAE